MRLALIGSPQSGKTSVFHAITGQAPDPAAAVQERVAVVSVPDERVGWLARLDGSKKVTWATLEFVDVPGFSLATAHDRAEFHRHMPTMRSCDGLVAVVRGFVDESVPAYRKRIDPAADLAELQSELLFGDLEQITNRIERLEAALSKPIPNKEKETAHRELQVARRCKEALEQEKPVSTVLTNEEEAKLVRSLALLTEKPLVAVLNVSEDAASDAPALTCADSAVNVSLCAKIEAELAELDAEDQSAFLADLGIAEPAGPRLIRACYEALGLVSFLTGGSDEARAWPVPRGTTALEAAGKIHTDMAKGFIRAETVAFSDLEAAGSIKQAKTAGKVRLEGKGYVVQDGDVIVFRFNV